MIKIILADDHDLVRTGIRRILEDVDDFTILAEAKNGEDAVLLCRKKRARCGTHGREYARYWWTGSDKENCSYV